MKRIYGIIPTLALGLSLAPLLAGCGALSPRTVKVPVAVPCLATVPDLEPLPVASMTFAEAEALARAGQYQVLADRLAATLRLLAAERRALQAQLKACAQLPPVNTVPEASTAK